MQSMKMTEEEAMEAAALDRVMELAGKTNAGDILQEAADTYKDRHAVYGDNYKLVGNAMKALFPDGLRLETPHDHNRFHILLLAVVKLTRYVQNWERGGHEDSLVDLSVYSAMLVEIDREGGV